MKRTIYKLFKSFIFISLLVCFAALLPIDYAVHAEVEAQAEEYKGLDFTDGSNCFTLGSALTKSPKTFEALVRINKKTNISNGRYGVIIGSFGTGNHTTNLEVKNDGYPSLWYDGKTVLQGSVAINTGEWTHVAFVRDSANSKVYCYVNGEAAGEATVATADVYPNVPFAVGMDNRGNTTYPLQGLISTISISSVAKTQNEIKASMANGIDQIGTNGVIYSASFADSYDASIPDAYYRSTKQYLETPNTFTATFKVASGTPGRIGSIIGNYAGGYSTSTKHPTNSINLEINDKGQLRFYWDTGNPDVVFTSKDFRTGLWEHVTVVRDVKNSCFHLYNNGVLLETKTTNTGNDITGIFAPAIGNDLRHSDSVNFPFKGHIKNVAVYSDALSSQEVAVEYATEDKKTITKETNEKLMFNWVLEDELSQKLKYDKQMPEYVYDYSGNENHAYLATVEHFYEVEDADWFKANNDEYTMIFYPDIQTTVSAQPQSLFKMNEWVKANASDMNLQFVMTLGDIIDGNPTQWRVTRTAFEIFDEANIPYSLVLGNHDYDENALSANNGRNASNFNSHFKYETFVNEEHFVEAKVVGKMENACYTYSALGVNYLIFALEFGPSDSTLAWASSVIERPEYNDYRVIVTTHSMLHSSGTFSDINTLHNPNDYGFVNSIGVDANTGQEMWDEFLSKHDNIFIAASGHIINDTVMRRVDTGDYGNQVLSMLIDGQGVKDTYGVNGATLMLVCKVNETTKTMTCNFYNPVSDMYFCVENQFTYDFSDVFSRQIEASEGVDVASFAKPGEKVEFTCEFASSSTHKKVVVADKKGNAIEFVEANGVYSFEMPDASVNIELVEFNVNELTLPTSLKIDALGSINLNDFINSDFGLVYELSGDCAKVVDGVIVPVKLGKATLSVLHPQLGVLGTVELTVTDHYCVFDQKIIDEDHFASEATCALPSQYYLSCSCGEIGTKTFSVGDTLEHRFTEVCTDEKYLASEATCILEAQYYFSCDCGAAGEETFAFGSLAEHTYASEATCHARECSVCHAILDATTEHTFGEGEVVLEATSTKEGVLSYSCTACGETKTEAIAKTIASNGCSGSILGQGMMIFSLLIGAIGIRIKRKKDQFEE